VVLVIKTQVFGWFTNFENCFPTLSLIFSVCGFRQTLLHSNRYNSAVFQQICFIFSGLSQETLGLAWNQRVFDIFNFADFIPVLVKKEPAKTP
jgi:hypothetical protein